MPHKIGFVVVGSSGHEDGFSAKELMVHAPTVSGWRSPRFCQYPQEIVLQMVERCRIRKLQLLAHQYMISSKIEFYISESLPEYFTPYQTERFRRLGYVALSDNEKTGYKARELKSVYVDAVGQYLKLIFHKNFGNRYNLYNQVALIAINIIGDPVDYNEENLPTRDKLIDQYLGSSLEEAAMDTSYTGKPDAISPLDDLAFDMYQDPEVAQIIRKLDEKKQEAVHHEHYDYAKKLKQAIADLQKVGERLGRYEVEKRCAVEKEDYDLAKQKKQQMEEYRQKVYQQLELHDLLDIALIRRAPEPSLEPLDHPSSPKPPQQHRGAASPQPDKERSTEKKNKKERQTAPEKQPKVLSPKPAPQNRSPSPPPPAPTPAATLPGINVDALPYDERPLPAQRKQKDDSFTYLEPDISEDIVGDTPRSRITGEPEPLTEKALREAGFAIEVFGEALVAGAYSKTWSYREDALVAVYKKLSDVPTSTSKDELKNMLRAAVFLIRRAVKDKVSSVFQASLRLLKMIITHYIPKHKLGKGETAHCVEKTLPDLLTRTGDTATRHRVMASNFIQEMAMFKEVKPLQIIPPHLLQPLKGTLPTRLALSQMELVENLVKEMGTDASGFTPDNVMKFALGALDYTTAEVRERAVRIILYLYQQNRAQVLEHMPTDDAVIRKNLLYKTLFDGFSKIDGRPTESELKAQKKVTAEEAERRKKEEIRALQEQLAALKEMQSEVQAGRGKEQIQKSKLDDRGKKAITSPSTAPPDEPDSSGATYLDNLCIFCGDRDESFTEEGLDLHYWKQCPMLKRCEHCKQVVEIASLTDHLLTECDHKDGFGKCQRCTEAVSKDHLLEHVKAKMCNPAKGDKVANRCPLCHENFTPGEEAWKSHLMGKDGCKMNPRRILALQRTQAGAQALKAGGSTVTKTGQTGAKQRPLIAGSKIPAPRAGLNKTTSKPQPKR
ncbi:centrosomal protein of 104 kDa [Dendropsophus ebraccatus]|uniref:centrosomal protein of 104 kDa n=1 Tax=Dendropsophus ebraccatus TaxID=150705 RepID=UPI0038311237